MKRREPISKIMSTQLFTLNHTNSLRDAEAMFNDNKLRHLPVVSGNSLVGILSLNDLKRISFVNNFGQNDGHVETAIYDLLTIEQVMTVNTQSVSPDTTIREAADILANNEFHSLPVVEDGKLKGMVTTTDLLYYLLDQY